MIKVSLWQTKNKCNRGSVVQGLFKLRAIDIKHWMGINIIILFSCPPFPIVNSDVTYDLDLEPALPISQIRTCLLSLQLHYVSVCALSIPFQASPQYFPQLHSPIPLRIRRTFGAKFWPLLYMLIFFLLVAIMLLSAPCRTGKFFIGQWLGLDHDDLQYKPMTSFRMSNACINNVKIFYTDVMFSWLRWLEAWSELLDREFDTHVSPKT